MKQIVRDLHYNRKNQAKSWTYQDRTENMDAVKLIDERKMSGIRLKLNSLGTRPSGVTFWHSRRLS